MTGKLTVAKVAPRDGRVCAHCGATDGLSVQHRANKGMGGSREAERLSNGIILCATYNALLEQSAAEAERAIRMGWKCSKYGRIEAGTHTSQVPFWHYPTQGWRLVFDDGTWRPATVDEVKAHLDRVTLAA